MTTKQLELVEAFRTLLKPGCGCYPFPCSDACREQSARFISHNQDWCEALEKPVMVENNKIWMQLHEGGWLGWCEL